VLTARDIYSLTLGEGIGSTWVKYYFFTYLVRVADSGADHTGLFPSSPTT